MRRSPFPILDIRVWRRDPTAFAAELRRACHVLGFFQLRHDAAAEAKEVTRQARRFFALPDRSKLACDYATSPAFRGYMRLGVENTAGAPDIREQVEYAAEGRPAAAGAWPPYERLRGPNQWPEELPELRTAVERYTSRMLGLGSELSSALALALGRETSAFDGLFSAPGAEPQPHWQLKLASYPAADPAAGAGAGVGAHTDSGFLTMLLQDEVGGLQAFTGGDWADVPPAGEEVIVCNLGEVAQLASGGYLLATPHRVLSTPRQRLSVPFFFNPMLEAIVEPVDLPASLVWEREEGQQHWKRPSNAMLSLNAFKSLARSHPAVFAQHHADLRVLDDGRVVRK